jgi:hypothetical protein
MSGASPLNTKLHAAILSAQIVECPGHDRASGVDDGDVIRDLVDVGEMVRREEHGQLFRRDVRDDRLQHFFAGRRIETRRRLVEHEQLRATTQRQQQRELAAHAERERVRVLVQRQLERAQVALLEIVPPAGDRTRR